MLSRVAINGFKSFARATTVDLGEGINVIVGPNGSGKSNLVEAILWALGEQRPAHMRADGMQQLLFGGDRSLKPAAFAEVSLTLTRDDADDGMPAQMEVSRRLTRAGEAHYRVDGVSCRLLDLRERLADWGLSSDGLAVIRQGQVERLCTSRPADIRAIIEESAGVAVSRRRRRRAELKLARVEDRLDRARDLASEVTSRRRALGRQARAAERAAELEQDVLDARVLAVTAAAWAAHQALGRAEGAQAECAGDRAEAQRLLEAARADRDGAAERLEQARARLRELEEARGALAAAAERVRGRGELAADRVAAEAERAERAERERRRAEERRSELEDEVQARTVGESQAREALAQAEQESGAAEEALRSQRDRERALRDGAAAASRSLAAAEQAVADAQCAAASAAEDLRRAEERAQNAGDIDDADEIDRADRREKVSSERLRRWEQRLAEADRAVRDVAAARDAADARLRECRAEAGRLDPDAPSAFAGSLGEELQVEAGAESAVAAALGALVEALPVKGVSAARKAIEDGAPAAVVPASAPEAGPAPDGARPLVDLVVACATAARPHIERLLADAWLVDDLASVPRDAVGLFVTSDGVALRPQTGVVVGARGAWARKAVFERALKRQQAAEAAACEATEAADVAAVALSAVRDRRRAAARSASRAEQRLAALRAARAGRAAEAQDAAHARESSERAHGEAHAAIEDAAVALDAAAAAGRTASEKLAAARPELVAAESAWRTAATAAADARAALAAESTARAEAAARLEAAVAASAPTSVSSVDIDLARRAIAALTQLGEGLATAAASIDQDVGAHRTSRDAAEMAHTAVHRDVERTETRFVSASDAANRADIDAAVAAERAKEAGEPPDDDPQAEPDAARARLDALKRSLEAVGPVNALAREELSEIDARRAEIEEQIDDLSEAASSLRGHLDELDDIVRTGFEEAMATVEERFAEVIGILFPGGRGQLRAVDEDQDDPGVVIEVVPAGKAARSLSLLSGGERSLVALSFQLSLAMTRPAPVYLLDEVEAALDDVNLRRFLTVVRRLSEASPIQFVLITHQQATVESADTLFGVTVEAGGASKLVSRKLDHAGTEVRRPQLKAIAGGGA